MKIKRFLNPPKRQRLDGWCPGGRCRGHRPEEAGRSPAHSSMGL